jgi:hypothetical protein
MLTTLIQYVQYVGTINVGVSFLYVAYVLKVHGRIPYDHAILLITYFPQSKFILRNA